MQGMIRILPIEVGHLHYKLALYCMGESVNPNREFGRTGWHRPLERSWKFFKKTRRSRSYYSGEFNSDEDTGENQPCVSTPTREENFYRRKHGRKGALNPGDCCSETTDFCRGMQCTPIESPSTPTFGSCMIADDFHIFNTSPRTLVRSLQKESSPESESGKMQFRKQYADADCDASRHAVWSERDSSIASDTDDKSRVEKQGCTTVALKGRKLLLQLESLANEVLDRSNVQEGDLQESTSIWSSSVRQSESISTAASRIFSAGSTDKQEQLPRSVQAVNKKHNHGLNHGEEESLKTDANSLEDSSISTKLQERWSFSSGWTKALSFVESILRGSLCVVLVVPAAMIAIKSFNAQEYHVLVPT